MARRSLVLILTALAVVAFVIAPPAIGSAVIHRPDRFSRAAWLLGESLLRDQPNVVAFKVGQGYVVTFASEMDYRAQPRATFKLIFNAMFHGPSTKVTAAQLAKLGGTTN